MRRATKWMAVKASGQRGAVDLASLMVGVIVLGVLGAIATAVLFAVILWSQDRSAQADLDAVKGAQSVARVQNGAYQSANDLWLQALTPQLPASITVDTDPSRDCFSATSASPTGKTYWIDTWNPAPAQQTATSFSSCGKIMRSTWDTRLPGCTTIVIPIGGTISATIDWGDGSPAAPATAGATHTYKDAPGVHNVTLHGTFTKYGSTTQTPTCLTDVTAWGSTGTTDLTSAFTNATNLKTVAAIPNTASILEQMFTGATKFNGNIGGWNTSSVTSMRIMFSGATAFNQNLNNWDVSKVKNMSGMFQSATNFNGDISEWNTGSVTDTTSMFNGDAAFNRDISRWNMSSATRIYSMFLNATSFNQPIGRWDISKAQSLSSMFNGAANFNQDISGWDTRNLVSLAYAFANAPKFNRDIGGWNTSKVTDLLGTFQGATAFNQDVARWNTSQVTKMQNTFSNAVAFDKSVASWDVSKVTSFASFHTGSKLTQAQVPAKIW